MNFMKYPTKNDISISNAVLKLAKLQNAERLELTAATGAVIVTSGRMTVKELLSTVQSLTGRAAELMTLLRLTCGDCTNCSEKCAYRDRSITELIRPAVVVPDWARQDAGLAGDAKLDCYVDEDTHELIGRSVRCTCLSDGEMTRWNRDEFVGVLDEKFLPDWAKESLSQFQQEEAAESPSMNNQSM